jgi:hypothetical protein
MKKTNMSERQGPSMRNPCMSREKTMELFYDFADYVTGKKEIPERFLKNDPTRRYANNNEIYELYEKYKNGPIDPLMVRPQNTIQHREKISSNETAY